MRRGGKEAGGEIATRGTRTASEAGRSGRASTVWRSPMPSRGRHVNAAGARGRWLVLSREVSAGVLDASSVVVRGVVGTVLVVRLVLAVEKSAEAAVVRLSSATQASACNAEQGNGRWRGRSPFATRWTAYFQLADGERPFSDLDEWLRRRLRQVRWKEWKRYPIAPSVSSRPGCPRDREVLDTCHELTQFGGQRVTLVSADTGMLMRARSASLMTSERAGECHSWLGPPWAGYFRCGNSTVQFDAIIRHAERRLQLWIAASHQQPWRYGRQQFAARPDRYGLIEPQRNHRRAPAEPTVAPGSRMPAVRDVGEPCAGNRMHGSMGGERKPAPVGTMPRGARRLSPTRPTP